MADQVSIDRPTRSVTRYRASTAFAVLRPLTTLGRKMRADSTTPKD